MKQRLFIIMTISALGEPVVLIAAPKEPGDQPFFLPFRDWFPAWRHFDGAYHMSYQSAQDFRDQLAPSASIITWIGDLVGDGS